MNEFGDNRNEYMICYVWPNGKTAFPDFFKDKTKEWWIEQIKIHYQNELTFDGFASYYYFINFTRNSFIFFLFYIKFMDRHE